ncbi:MAG: hypothetical protein ABIH49_00240 [archaeon]
MKRRISDVVIFDGTLEELNRQTGEEYIDSGENFVGEPYPIDQFIIKTQIDLRKKGYDALIRARPFIFPILISTWVYYSGIPVIRKSRLS